jgi:cell division protein FtsL
LERSRQLFRDFGLTLALLLAAVVIYWKTTTPALKRNALLSEEQQRLRERRDLLDLEVKRLRAAEAGKDDPETIERFAREQYGASGLPQNEVIVGPEPGDE